MSRIKDELKTHGQKLDTWRRGVPSRAERFHRRLDSLTREIEEALSRWFPRKSELEQVRGRVERLQPLADRLPSLLQKADAVTGKLDGTTTRGAGLGAELDDWLRERREQWSSQLELIGRNVERENDLIHEEYTVSFVEKELQHYSRALGALREAEELAGKLNAEDTLPLQGRLPGLKAQLREDGPSEAWLDELHELTAPLSEVLERLKVPPPPLQMVTSILNDLRGWSRLLGNEQEVTRLEERKRHFAVEWTQRDPAEIEELRVEAEQMRQRLFDQAQKERKKLLNQLEEQMKDFFDVCGYQQDVDQRLDELKAEHRRLDKPSAHPRWLQRFQDEKSRFKGQTESHWHELISRLDELRQRLGKGLEELHEKPFSNEVKERVEKLERELERLGKIKEVEEMLRTLRQEEELEKELLGIKEQVREDLQEVSAKKDEIQERYKELTEAADRLKLEVKDLRKEIEGLDVGDRSLEEARNASGQVEELLAEQERSFAAGCRREWKRIEQEATASLELLRRAGADPDWEDADALDELTRPAEVAAAFESNRNNAWTLKEKLREELVRHDQERRTIVRRLKAIPTESLSLVDQDDVKEVLEALAEEPGSGYSKPHEELERLLELIHRSEVLFEQLRQEEIDAERHHQELLGRWRDFKDAHLKRYCPELAARVEALIYGIPKAPQSWRDLRPQLEQAEKLFQRLNRQARRLAARDLHRDLSVLRQFQRASAPGEDVAKIAELTAEVDALEDLRLPPATLRMQIRNAARSARRGTHG